MRRLRQLSMAVVLTLMLGTCGLAGIIDCPPAPAPPPSSVMATGTIDTPPSNQQNSAGVSDPIIDVALNLLQSVLSVF
jgi:hypothetical protein